MRNKFIIIGAGKLGSYLAEKLSLEGENVIVIDKDKNKLGYLPLTFSGLTYAGDATLIETLEANNINTCKCLICLTENDNTNIYISHIAKVFFDIPNIFVRLNDPNKSVLVDKLGIQTISPFTLGVEQFNKMRKRIK
ncbi:MAG: potassium channel family protein [Bacillales bacterium]